MAPNNKKNVKNGGLLPSWLLFPPTILPVVLPLFYFLRTPSREPALSTPVVALMSMAYIALSLAYRTLSEKGSRKGANASALLANGVLFVFLADYARAGALFGWIGLAMLLVGLIGAMGQLNPPPAARFAKVNEGILPQGIERPAIKRILDAVVFPAAFLEYDENGEERVMASNEPFAAVLGKSADKIPGLPFSALLPPYEEGAKFKFVDLEWIPRRVTRGKQTLFMMSPLEKSTEQPIVEMLDVIDPDTGLYVEKLMEYKGKSDVEGCRRYRRRLAVALFRLDFDKGGAVPPSEEVRAAAFAAFGHMVAASIRSCDSAYRMGDADVILFMPDTAQGGAKTVISRIHDRMRKIASGECVELAAANLQDGLVCFFGDNVESLEHAVNEAYVSIARQDG